MPEAKNIIYKSSVYAKGNIHVGDVYNINGKEKEIPLRLNIIPHISSEDVLGRKKDLARVKNLLTVSDKLVLLNGIGGIGKTTMAKYFVATNIDQYKYIAWINASSDIKFDFINDNYLIDSLQLREEIENIEKKEDWLNLAFSLVINRLRQLGGNDNEERNLLIIDNAGEDIEHTQILDQISLRPNWKVLVTSRIELEGFSAYEIITLNQKNAFDLFLRHYQYEREKLKEQEVITILEIIDFHTLLIELIAKVANSLRLPLVEVINRLKKKGLNISSNSAIKFQHNYNQKVANVFEYILEMFEIANLNEKEHWVLKQFAVLPSIPIPYKNIEQQGIVDLLQIKKEDYKDNFTMALNRLVDKGFLQRNSYSDAFKMHNILQEVIRHKLVPNTEDCSDLVQELFSRMSYQNANILSPNNRLAKEIIKQVAGKSTIFAELIDEYASVIQRFYDYEQSITLQLRALEMKKSVIPANHIKLADSHNSLALGYLNLGNFDKALIHQLQDLEITILNSQEENYDLAITYNNLSLIYRETKEFDIANEYQAEAMRIAKIINDKDLDNVVYNNSGNLQYLQKNFAAALKSFKISLEIRIANGDQLWISEAHYNLGTAYIECSDFINAKEHLDKAYEIEKDLVPNKSSFASILYGYGLLNYELGNFEKSEAYFSESLEIFSENFAPDHYKVIRGKDWLRKVRGELEA